MKALKNKLKPVVLGITASAANIPSSAFAAATDGFNKVNEGLNWWCVGLGSLAVATITLCIMWIGYKVLFDGKKISDMTNVMMGGGLIGGAAGFAAWYTA
ncbi:TPA: TrbC/VirB2 family protein [Escherichia coli]|jgi:type IV secretion system protein VirB2|uniref:TrbC/VirB2 family protein n=1 Tax=Klebsiella pneumoniae TaxID=573 RepID=UPI0013235D0A|nr:TrbC/VirB2 family protein [Klebsiella pneumoniae]EGI4400592.1 conjugal transfer protein [Escherichia coli]EHL5992539.1 TrbC/VirB2 family protein [Escherichia coli]EHL9236277.1 TrbC/VirB2 family protein [Escherichia coli]EID7217677.1 TrbC/VirB2 family protein [Escherichia coli]ELO3218012.1 TrbC/VirB2 family protein [Escherichia coli]